MAYRFDSDLEFLGTLSAIQLAPLVDILTKDDKGNPRLTEELTGSDIYKRYSPHHHKYWREIAAEVQLFGANTIASIFRGGKGVLYREVLIDVAEKLKVNFNKNSSVEIIEYHLLVKLFDDLVAKMTPAQLKDLTQELGISSSLLTPQAVTASFIKVFNAGGFKSYQLSVTIANMIMKFIFGRGLTIAGNAMLTRVLSIVTGPVGWAITGVWTAADIASPAFRVTVPAVVCIAALRAQSKMA